MATVQLTTDSLTVRLTRGEKIAGLHRDLTVPLSAVTGVEVVPDALSAVRGVRAPGLAVPGRRIGTWRGRGTRRLVSVRRGQPAVRLHLTGQCWDELLVSTPAAQSLADRLAAQLSLIHI